MSNVMKPGKGLYIVVLGMSLWCSLASAQITCASGSACQTNFVPVFTSNGGNAKVADSIIQQSGSNVVVGGNLSANEFVIGGNLFAFGSYAQANAFLGFAGNSTTTESLTSPPENSLSLKTPQPTSTPPPGSRRFTTTPQARRTPPSDTLPFLLTTPGAKTQQ